MSPAAQPAAPQPAPGAPAPGNGAKPVKVKLTPAQITAAVMDERATTTAARTQRADPLERLLYSLDMTPPQYIRKVVLPLVGLGIAMAVMLPFVLGGMLGGLLGTAAGVLVGVGLGAAAFILPWQLNQARKSGINQQMHMFITHLGVLATTPMSRVDIFGAVADRKDYGPLSKECKKIVTLARHWHLSLPQACRFVAARTPSDLLCEFLDRLAHALEAGDALQDFLANEQAVVMHQYASQYERRLNDLNNFRELFSSMMMSVTFLSVFALLTPLLAGIQATELMPMVILATFGLLLVLLALAHAKVPRDPLWARVERNEAERRAMLFVPVCATIGAVLGGLVWSSGAGLSIALAVGSTPMALASMVLLKEEGRVRRRDDNYPAFIRSLGTGVSAKSGSPQDVIEALQRHNYGPLTPPLRALYRRLSMKFDTAVAWNHFTRESGSHLITSFQSMFLESSRSGGNSLTTGGIISENIATILALRKQREQVVAGLRGIFLGLSGAIAFTLYLNLSIVGMLSGLFTDLSSTKDILPGLGTFKGDVAFVANSLAVLTVAYAAGASLILRVASGGRLYGAFVDFVIMVWIGVGVSQLVGSIAGVLL